MNSPAFLETENKRKALTAAVAKKEEGAAVNALVRQRSIPLHDGASCFGNMRVFDAAPYGIYQIPVQPKLMVSRPDDVYEQEADATADKVMRMQDVTDSKKPLMPGAIQRKCAHCEEDEKMLQRKAAVNATPAVSPAVVQSLQSSGQPLDAGTRSFMEQRFGYNFGHVKVHNDALAHRSAEDINALAYTQGHHVVFGAGRYRPGTVEGNRLLAHELTHVVQQDATGPGHIRRQVAMPVPVPIPAPIAIPLGTIAVIIAVLALLAISVYAAYKYLMSKLAELIAAVEAVSASIEDYIRQNPRDGMKCSAELIAFRTARDNVLDALRNPARFGPFGVTRRLQIFKDATNALAQCLGLPPIF